MWQVLGPGLNAYRCAFDPQLLLPLQARYLRDIAPVLQARPALLEGGRVWRQRLDCRDYGVFSYDRDPLLWIAPRNPKAFVPFRDFFRALQLTAPIALPLKQGLRLYGGFWVVSEQIPHPLWHLDYREQVPAYTVITPLFDLASGHGPLWYRDPHQQIQSYPYRLGELIALGSGFVHTPAPYPKQTWPRVLLSLTFGTDTWQAWSDLRHAIGRQSHFYYLPCGHQAGRCFCYAGERVLDGLRRLT